MTNPEREHDWKDTIILLVFLAVIFGVIFGIAASVLSMTSD